MSEYLAAEATLLTIVSVFRQTEALKAPLQIKLVCAAGRTEVFGSDGLEADNLQSSGSQNQLATPRVEVLQKHNRRTVLKLNANSMTLQGFPLDDSVTAAGASVVTCFISPFLFYSLHARLAFPPTHLTPPASPAKQTRWPRLPLYVSAPLTFSFSSFMKLQKRHRTHLDFPFSHVEEAR